MIEDQLINYGVLGIWTATLLIDRYKFQNKLGKVIEENTKSNLMVYAVITNCKKKR